MVAMESIGRYRLVRRIGAGSFATVWLGHDDDLDVPVAVKVLADNWAANSDVRNRFLAEARIMRRIHDQRLVQVYDIGSLADGRPYFVMDYIDGGSLNELRQQGIEPVRALRLCAEACRALDVLHANDIIHRDVSPGNLLLSKTANGAAHVLIADLGVAKSMVDAVGATMTAGTPSYMAPEQAMGVTPLDKRVDIYSLTAQHCRHLGAGHLSTSGRNCSTSGRTSDPRRGHGLRAGCRPESPPANGTAPC
jgi:serine/threonine protein kinase